MSAGAAIAVLGAYAGGLFLFGCSGWAKRDAGAVWLRPRARLWSARRVPKKTSLLRSALAKRRVQDVADLGSAVGLCPRPASQNRDLGHPA